jgi:hypothetical protein
MSISLIIEEIDGRTNCIEKSFNFDPKDIEELEALLDIEFSEDPNIEYEYNMSDSDVKSLSKFYNLGIVPKSGAYKLRSRAPFDNLPYTLHTGRELSLMLSGVKPMSYFVYHEGDESRDPVEEAFERFAPSHNIRRHEYTLILDQRSHRKADYIVFTLPGEEWRANALILVKKSSLKAGWSEGLERMEGTLLGYEDWQNDLYIEYLKSQFMK